jgi:hypothetical protein
LATQSLPQLGGQAGDDALGEAPHDALFMGEISKAPGVGGFEPGAVVEQPFERYLEHSFELIGLVDETGDRPGRCATNGTTEKFETAA